MTRRKIIIGSTALAAAATLPLLPTESEIVMAPWQPRVLWRMTWLNNLQNAVDTMDAFLRGEYGDIGVLKYGHEERIEVVRGGPQEFRWIGEHDTAIGRVYEGGVLVARVVGYEVGYRRGGGREVSLDLIWTSTGLGRTSTGLGSA